MQYTFQLFWLFRDAFFESRVKGANPVSAQERQQMEKEANDVMDSILMFMEDKWVLF